MPNFDFNGEWKWAMGRISMSGQNYGKLWRKRKKIPIFLLSLKYFCIFVPTI